MRGIDRIAADRRHLVAGIKVASGYSDPGRVAVPVLQAIGPAAPGPADVPARLLARLLAWPPAVRLPSMTQLGVALGGEVDPVPQTTVRRAFDALICRGVVEMARAAGPAGPSPVWAVRIVASGVVLLSERAPAAWADGWHERMQEGGGNAGG